MDHALEGVDDVLGTLAGGEVDGNFCALGDGAANGNIEQGLGVSLAGILLVVDADVYRGWDLEIAAKGFDGGADIGGVIAGCPVAGWHFIDADGLTGAVAGREIIQFSYLLRREGVGVGGAGVSLGGGDGGGA